MTVLQPEYTRALGAYVSGGSEQELMHAYALGRESLSEGLTQVVTLHGAALKEILADGGDEATRAAAVERATQFLAEALAPFEMTVRGFQETNARLREANAEMERAARLKDDFLSQMSHELRTPLNSVLGFSQLLLSQEAGPLNEKQLRYCSNIRHGGDMLLELVNDLLDLGKIRAGLVRLSTERVAVAPVIDECLAQVYPLVEGKRLHLERQINPKASVVADRARLAQVLLNLLSNGIKFTPEGGRIGIAAQATRGTVKIAVRDTGVGIPADQLERVFEAFVQLEPGHEYGRQGTGLALALSKRLVELMGGTLDLDSWPGTGSTFTIALPAAT